MPQIICALSFGSTSRDVLTAHGADDFQRGGSKGGKAIFWHMKTSVGVGAEIEREIACTICHLSLRAFFSIGCMLCMRLHTKQFA